MKKLIRIMLPLVFLLIGMGICYRQSGIRFCWEDTVMPEYPIYSDAELISDHTGYNARIHLHRIFRIYEVEASLEDVVAFYSGHGQCERSAISNSYACRGETSRENIEYFMGITAENDLLVSYYIQIDWSSCS